MLDSGKSFKTNVGKVGVTVVSYSKALYFRGLLYCLRKKIYIRSD